MRPIARFVLLFLALTLFFLPATESAGPPNIVMIVSDDHGWRDYGFMGHPHIKTPALDRLAAESLTFPRGYTPTPLCSPSLMSIITGRYPHEHLITSNDPPAPLGGKQGNWREDPAYLAQWEQMRRLSQQTPALPQLLQSQGYLSFQTGKWWMGNYRSAGFTHGMSHGDKSRGGRHGDEGLEIGRQGMAPIYDFIAEARQRQRPFLVWYAPLLPHSPHTAPSRLIEKYRAVAPSQEHARYWASVEWFDETIGELLDHLDRQGLAKETIVVYVTDNGWVQSEKGDAISLRSKRTPYEAGVRTPILLRWPGRIKPERSERYASTIDLVPTLLAATGGKIAPELPGIDLRDRRSLMARRRIFGENFTHDAVDIRRPSTSLLSRWIIDDGWKLILPVPGIDGEDVPDRPLLYQVERDPDELQDLAAREPRRVAQLRRRLDAWWSGR